MGSQRTIAVLGTGIMGAPIAANLAAAGMSVRAWNRTRSRAEPLAEHGVEVCDTPAAAVRDATFLLTMLADADAVEESVFGTDGACKAVPASAVWLQCSTVGTTAADRLGRLAEERDVPYLDTPVLGTRKPAEDAALVVLASGPRSLREKSAPVFDAIGRRTIWISERPGDGSRMKLVVNNWVLSIVTAVSESVALAEAFDLDPSTFFDALEGTQLDVPYARLKGDLMMRGSFPASFPVGGAGKDAALIVDAMRSAGVHGEVAAANAEKFRATRDAGLGRDDMAAVVLHSLGRSHEARARG